MHGPLNVKFTEVLISLHECRQMLGEYHKVGNDHSVTLIIIPSDSDTTDSIIK